MNTEQRLRAERNLLLSGIESLHANITDLAAHGPYEQSAMLMGLADAMRHLMEERRQLALKLLAEIRLAGSRMTRDAGNTPP